MTVCPLKMFVPIRQHIYISGECAVVCNHSPEYNNQFKDSLQAYFHRLAFNFDDVDTFRLYR